VFALVAAAKAAATRSRGPAAERPLHAANQGVYGVNTRYMKLLPVLPETSVYPLPIASTEQHGPHLPIATDVAIANGMLAELKTQRPDDLDFLVLPTQEIGKANEHVYGPGSLSFGPEILIPAWTAIGAKVAEAGIRKLVIVNSRRQC